MIFCETKREVDELALNPDLRQETHVIHGDIPQAKRDLVLSVSMIIHCQYLRGMQAFNEV
jgi:superfamily II DNA/RNA helicase